MKLMADLPFETSSREFELRQRLGIPAEARQVLIFAESSHWDPDWLLTSQEYFDRFVRRNLDRVLLELLHDRRRVYSIECVFFLRMYWDACPDKRDLVRELVNNEQLLLTGSGVTTADTLLPSPEAILRDMLNGQEWLRKNGMTQEPRLAYFPDSFGYSPGLPSLLNAAGFTLPTITRIDGMWFPGCDYELPSHFYQADSSAGILLKKEKSLDFIWRDSSGGEILCHWNAFTYGQGDLLAHQGVNRAHIYNLARPNR